MDPLVPCAAGSVSNHSNRDQTRDASITLQKKHNEIKHLEEHLLECEKCSGLREGFRGLGRLLRRLRSTSEPDRATVDRLHARRSWPPPLTGTSHEFRTRPALGPRCHRWWQRRDRGREDRSQPRGVRPADRARSHRRRLPVDRMHPARPLSQAPTRPLLRAVRRVSASRSPESKSTSRR